MEAFALVASCLAAVGQLWFWHLHTHEQRSLWYGLSFLVAVGTAVVAIEVILLQAFSLESHPVAEQINLVVIGVMAVTLLAFPVALVVTLVASGVRLIRREGANPRNMLSLGLGILMVAYVIVWPQVRSALASHTFTVPLSANSSRAMALQVEWQYNGSYGGVDLPVLECGGSINRTNTSGHCEAFKWGITHGVVHSATVKNSGNAGTRAKMHSNQLLWKNTLFLHIARNKCIA